MRQISQLLVGTLFALLATTAQAADYTTYLTAERGFTEVTSTAGLLAGDYYYAIASAENKNYYVGICNAGDRKAGWAPDNSLAMCYHSAANDPVLNRKNFWILEKSGSQIGFRNLHHNICLFQTNDGQGYLYFAGFYYEHNISEWDCLTPTFQDGYWMFESGKYPISSGDWASGYLGPWNHIIAEGETMALNRKNVEGDLAGHYRLYRIPKATFESLYTTETNKKINAPVAGQPVDYTSKITNPSFETGDITGWTMTPTEGNDMGARDYTLTGMEGKYCGNFYCWWKGVSIEQTISNLPAGTYKISAVMGTWEDKAMNFAVNDHDLSAQGKGDGTGVHFVQTLTLTGSKNSITVKAYQNTNWWDNGDGNDHHNCIGFIKLDDVRLTYYSSIPALPNDKTTQLTPNTWYYYDAPASGRYTLTSNKIASFAYADELPDMDTYGNLTKSEMGFPAGRIYFKTKASGATLKVEPASTASTFTAATLNVDGLPSIANNSDGPGSSGTKLISTYLNKKGFDVIAFEEDFNFHSELTSNISGYTWGKHRGKVSATALAWGADTDGLEFATRNAAASWSGESYVQFNKTTSTDGNQYIKKGYRYYMVTLADGNIIDVYITHLDAGNEAATGSRPQQLQQIANAILSKGNTDRPKIFMGDTNCRWTREDIKANFFDLLTDKYDVSDAWVELCRDGIYPTAGTGTLDEEVVDKIIYINPKGEGVKKIIPISYLHDAAGYVNSSGSPLGDHAPVVVTFGIGTYETVDNTVTILAGDVNYDGSVTIADVTALVNVILGKDSSEYDLEAADVNGDGSVTIADVTALVNIILGK